MEEAAVDALIARLLDAKNGRTVRQVHMTEPEIRQLCLAAKEVFLSQPNLLELEAPIKICGKRLRNGGLLPKFVEFYRLLCFCQLLVCFLW